MHVIRVMLYLDLLTQFTRKSLEVIFTINSTLFQCGGSVSGSNGPHAPISPTALQNSISHNVSILIPLIIFLFTYLNSWY